MADVLYNYTLRTLYDEYIDRTKLTEPKKNSLQYSSCPANHTNGIYEPESLSQILFKP